MSLILVKYFKYIIKLIMKLLNWFNSDQICVKQINPTYVQPRHERVGFLWCW